MRSVAGRKHLLHELPELHRRSHYESSDLDDEHRTRDAICRSAALDTLRLAPSSLLLIHRDRDGACAPGVCKDALARAAKRLHSRRESHNNLALDSNWLGIVELPPTVFNEGTLNFLFPSVDDCELVLRPALGVATDLLVTSEL